MVKTKPNILKRSLSVLLALMMCLGAVSVAAFAQEEQTPQQQLKALLDEINEMDSTLYTEESWKALSDTASQVASDPLSVSDFVAEWYVAELTKLKSELVLAAPVGNTPQGKAL